MENNTAQTTETAPGSTATAENETPVLTAPEQTGQTEQKKAEDTAILTPETAEQKKEDTAILTPETAEKKKDPETPQGAPEQYADFTLPDGFTLEGEAKEKATGLFRELNLSQENAQKLIDFATERDLAGREAQLNELSAKRKEWRSEIRSRPDFDADLALAKRGMRALVQTPEGAALFNDSWMCDHPAVFDIFVRAGKLVSEDTFGSGGTGGADENINRKRFPVQ